MMDVDEFEMERETSAPIDMLEHYFNAHGWAYERNGDEEIVATFQGSWAQYELRAIWRDDDNVLQFLALPDIRVAADKRTQTYETIGLINEQLWLGHFEMWSGSGLIVFRHSTVLDTRDGEGLTLTATGLPGGAELTSASGSFNSNSIGSSNRWSFIASSASA